MTTTPNIASLIDRALRARQRNDLLIPIMEEHGFLTAGEAIDWLIARDSIDDTVTEYLAASDDPAPAQ